METTTVSSKYQVVIPRRVREALGIQPGQRLHVFALGNSIHFVAVKPMREYRGLLRGIDPTVEREDEERR